MGIIALLKRPLLFVVCITIVAAIEGHLAAAVVVSEDLPVPGGVAAFAATLNFRPAPDRARFLSEVARLVHGLPTRSLTSATELVEKIRQMGRSGAQRDELVPVPLTPAVWSNAVFHRRVAAADLIVTILSDRQASLLSFGLTALDDQTLQYFIEHPSIVTELYEKHAALFAVFGASVRIRDGRIAPPGGDDAVPLWEAVTSARVDQPERFLAALFTHSDGRLAYLYDTIGQLDRARSAFALGLWIGDPAVRLASMHALVAAWVASFTDWRVRLQPFARQPYDSATALARVRVKADGSPYGPGGRELWSRVLESADVPEDSSAVHEWSADRPIDAAWLVAAMTAGSSRIRADRLDQFTYGQRLFADATDAEAPAVFVALRAYRRYRMLVGTFERMGIRNPELYASAARQAARMTSLDPDRAFVATAEFQGALVVLQRMLLVGTLDRGKAEELVASLVAVPLNDSSRYGGGLVRWIATELQPAIGRTEAVDTEILAALSGPVPTVFQRVNWEGRRYRVDLAAAEQRRLARVREKQGGVGLDQAIEVEALAQRIAVSPTLEVLREVSHGVKTVVSTLADVNQRAINDPGLPPGVSAPPDPLDRVARASLELDRAIAKHDPSRAHSPAVELFAAADELAAGSLVSLVYALYIGDPEGAALMVGDISRRHDFGFGARDGEARQRTAWALPRPDVVPGIPWHVTGSLLGLDVGLGALQLRRLSTDRVVDAPTLTSNERDTFANTIGLLNPFAMNDAARDAVDATVERGRARVSSLRTTADVERVANQLELDGWRRRAIAWTVINEPDRLESFFSLGEFLALGNPRPDLDLHMWGMAGIVSTGCLCTIMPAVAPKSFLKGRPAVGLVATAVPDVNLYVLHVLRDLRVPAPLAKTVLGLATQDFLDAVRPSDTDDWLTLVRSARTMARTQMEDYVAAAAANGPLILDEGAPQTGP